MFGVFICSKVNSLSLCLTWFYVAAACDGEVKSPEVKSCVENVVFSSKIHLEKMLWEIFCRKQDNLYFSGFFFSRWKLIFSENYHKPEFSFWICLPAENAVKNMHVVRLELPFENSRDWGFVQRWDGAFGGQGNLRRVLKAPRITLSVIDWFWKEFDLEGVWNFWILEGVWLWKEFDLTSGFFPRNVWICLCLRAVIF